MGGLEHVPCQGVQTQARLDRRRSKLLSRKSLLCPDRSLAVGLADRRRSLEVQNLAHRETHDPARAVVQAVPFPPNRGRMQNKGENEQWVAVGEGNCTGWEASDT